MNLSIVILSKFSVFIRLFGCIQYVKGTNFIANYNLTSLYI